MYNTLLYDGNRKELRADNIIVPYITQEGKANDYSDDITSCIFCGEETKTNHTLHDCFQILYDRIEK